MFSKIFSYMSFAFVQNAMIVTPLIALCAGLLGIIVCLKKIHFIGDGLSHVAFFATTVASIASLSSSIFLELIFTLIISVFLFKANRRKNNDAILAITSVLGLSCGYLALNLFAGNNGNLSGDVCGYLFGATSILTLKRADIITAVVMSVIAVAFFVICYNRVFDSVFDSDFAKAGGTNIQLYNVLIAILIDIVIVLTMKLVGALLVTALLIFPSLSALNISKSFKGSVILSSILSVVGATSGLLLSIVWGTPVGCTIVAIDGAMYVLSFVWSFIAKRRG